MTSGQSPRARQVTPADLAAVEKLKAEGNFAFRKGKYAAAIERYTEALLLAPNLPVLRVNRALNYLRKGELVKAVEDCSYALRLDPNYMKAHFFMGQALLEQGELLDATPHLSKALELARQSGDTIKEQIWRELAKAKYRKWQLEATARQEEQRALAGRLRGLLRRQQDTELAEEPGDEAAQAVLREAHAREDAALAAVLDRAAAGDRAGEAAGAVTCCLTMEVFREPVMLPSGLSYEDSALAEHFAKVGHWDPITKEPCKPSQAVRNLSLRAAAQQYLEEHNWAYGEIC
ncbi:hypothetical protein WJX81_006731 [Elliptochloris bilobata]|uniref:RING-type E3 ubiquitin transferase n=1 Tax=Elliptochloris bilobata TaxID=381761 RepID=A0AAW1RED2_9CHLO